MSQAEDIPPPTGQELAALSWRDLLARFLSAQGLDDWAGRVPGQDPSWGLEIAFDPVSRGSTPIPMGYLGTSYVESFATVQWPQAVLHLTVQDSKTEAANDVQDFTIPKDWMAAFMAVPWPITGAQPWF